MEDAFWRASVAKEKTWKNQEKLDENHQQVAFDHEIMLI
jgi:hypothetical protein